MKKSFILYYDQYEPIKNLTLEQKGILLDLLFCDTSEKQDVLVNGIYLFFKQQIKRDLEKWEQIREKRIKSGSLGGINKAKQKVANASKCKQKVANLAVTVNDNVTVTVNDNVNNNIVSSKEETLISYFSSRYEKYYNTKYIAKKEECIALNKLARDIDKQVIKNKINSLFEDSYWFNKDNQNTIGMLIKRINEIKEKQPVVEEPKQKGIWDMSEEERQAFLNRF